MQDNCLEEQLISAWVRLTGILKNTRSTKGMVYNEAIVMLVAGHTSFAGVCLADPAAWLSVLILLVPYYLYRMHKFSRKAEARS